MINSQLETINQRPPFLLYDYFFLGTHGYVSSTKCIGQTIYSATVAKRLFTFFWCFFFMSPIPKMMKIDSIFGTSGQYCLYQRCIWSAAHNKNEFICLKTILLSRNSRIGSLSVYGPCQARYIIHPIKKQTKKRLIPKKITAFPLIVYICCILLSRTLSASIYLYCVWLSSLLY